MKQYLLSVKESTLQVASILNRIFQTFRLSISTFREPLIRHRHPMPVIRVRAKIKNQLRKMILEKKKTKMNLSLIHKNKLLQSSSEMAHLVIAPNLPY